jgi:hypothetical protein
MLPSAVNDTMRDMMAQIRDVGDGIRGGTYTMTAPVITGGSITGVALSGNTLTNPVITGGSINNTPIGASTANTGAFTTLGATGVATFSAGTVSAPAITTTGDTNTGIFFPAADTIAFTEGGTEVMRVTSDGRLGVGTTSPQKKLSVSNGGAVGLDIDPTGRSGEAATSLLSFNRSTSAYVPAQYDASQHEFQTSNTERMRITSGGAVGINTSSPVALLTVDANQAFNSEVGNLMLRNSADTTKFMYLGYDNSLNAGYIQAQQSGVNWQPLLLNPNAGNVGIGTSSPASKLHVSQTYSAPSGGISADTTGLFTKSNTANGNCNISILSRGTGFSRIYFGSDAIENAGAIEVAGGSASGAGSMRFYTNDGTVAGTERMRIDASGNVGIGTSSPNGKVQITGASGSRYLTLDAPTNGGYVTFQAGGTAFADIGSRLAVTGGGASTDLFINTRSTYPLVFGTGDTERMRITSGGELLIGATSNATPTSSTSMAVLQSNFRNGGTYGMGMSFNSTGATGADHYYISFNTATTTQRGYIYYNNGAGQVQLSATSDARLKENIVDAPSILPILDQVKVRQYDWKDTGNTNIGFVAQELYDVIPRAVAVGEDNENGSIKRVWGVDNGTLVPYLVKAIQELNAKITALENK